MYNWNEHNKLKTILSQDKQYAELVGGHQIHCRPAKFLKWVEFLKKDLNFHGLVDISFHGKSRTYSFCHFESSQRVHLHLEVKGEELVPSIAHLYGNAKWIEIEKKLLEPRAGNELLSIPKIKFNPNRSEKPYIQESYIWEKYDFFSPTVDKQFEVLSCYHEGKLIDAQVDVGFHHKGFEEKLSANNYESILKSIDSINLNIAPTYSILFAKSIEESHRIKVPQRAQAIRIIQLELARIVEHMKVINNTFSSFNFLELSKFYKFKFRFLDILRKLSIENNKVSVVIGGVSVDVPFGWINEYRVLSEDFLKHVESFHQTLSKNDKICSVMKQGGVNPRDMVENGITGPNMRASGVNLDFRKSNPFYFYSEIDFDVPVEVNGSSWDRYLIRYQELIQSILIINQVVDNLPLGEILLSDVELQTIPKGSFFASYIESPQGQSGVSWVMGENSRLDSFRIVTPHFNVAQSLMHSLQGIHKEHLAPHLASLGLNSLEIDR